MVHHGLEVHVIGILLNKRWKNRINWTGYISERDVAVLIAVNNQPVLLMSVYFAHLGYADHHVEMAYRAIEKHTKSRKYIPIVGGDFHAELRLDTGIERISVGQYTLNEGNKRGDWMKQ